MAHNLLGVDYGSKRVGVALAAAGGQPQRLTTLAGDSSLLEELGRLLSAHGIDTVVVGLPRNLDGEDTAQTAMVRVFGAQLRAAHPEVVLTWQDEALTSEIARDRLRQQKVTDVAAILDQEAAVIILEDYLEEYAAQD